MTVTVPGRPSTTADLLTGGSAPRRPAVPPRQRALALVVLLVLGGGVAAAVDQRTAPPPAAAVRGSAFAGAAATARVIEEEERVVLLGLQIDVEGSETGRGDTNGPPEPERLRLVDLAARGFSLRLLGRSTPLVLGEIGRFGSGEPYVVRLGVEAVVVDCSVEVGAPRTIRLSLRRGDGPVSPVVVGADAEVVRALDDVVRRTCRRPRG